MATDSDQATVRATDSLLIVKPAAAKAQREHDLSSATQPAGEPGGAARPATKDDFRETQPGVFEPKPASKTRFFGSKELNPDRYALDFKKISDEVIAHLAAAPGVALTVRIEVEASTQHGFGEATVRTVGENANTLRFDQSGFESE